MQATPLVSIVIPTARRPGYLPLAVESALASTQGTDCEVIVVPNGPDDSWTRSLAGYSADPRVRVVPVARPNANVARNAGLATARGRFVRFLDDDDTLDAESSADQCALLERTGGELCSGSVRVVDATGAVIDTLVQRDADDLVRAMARPRRVCLPTAHLFRRSALVGERWDEALSVEQDTDWMLGLCSRREWHWLPIDAIVGSWLQHGSPRTSKGITHHGRARSTAELFLRSVDSLRARAALDETRADAFAEGLWDCVHRNFYKAPGYWARIARTAMALSPGRRPAEALFERGVFSRIDPVLLEVLMLPKRWLNEARRQVRGE